MKIRAYENAIIETGQLPIICADSGRIHQLFQNLIENGLKYNESLFKKIEVSCRCLPKRLEFRIKDNGIGIPLRYRDQIFDMFRRLHNQEKYRGSGIGLAICKKVVESYGGQISVTSEPGQGTAFFLSFPSDQLQPRLPMPVTEEWAYFG